MKEIHLHYRNVFLFLIKKAYLELNDWNVNDAFEAAREEGDHNSPSKNSNGGVYYFEDKKSSQGGDECTFLCNRFSSFFRKSNSMTKVGIDNN